MANDLELPGIICFSFTGRKEDSRTEILDRAEWQKKHLYFNEIKLSLGVNGRRIETRIKHENGSPNLKKIELESVF